MLTIEPSKIYISSANVDMRKSIDGLSSIVEQKFKLDPFSDAMFVFHNRHCDKIKILYWDGDGFCLLYKRMEKGKFHFPKKLTGDTYTVSHEELDWLMHGLSVEEMRHYNRLKNKKFSTCWVHLRRYFYNAFELQEDKNDFGTPAGQALLMIGRIFSAEKLDPKKPAEKSSLSLEEIAEIRKNISQNLAEEFFDLCEKQSSKCLPRSVLGKAISYALNQKETLMRFLEDPRIELTNNAAERAVKPFVIGRKNWLFCNTPSGAQASAIIYSIIETSKANGKNPQSYLENVFEGIRNGRNVDDFLPWNI